ncbi:putative F-box protein At5g55150 [Miscanthus floridulus]|uniref:putative F-box protein At5g55150 n=1 Tax=Miscanthus floridulus TaxID=154761 RepID=UPI00345B012A
MAQPPNPKRRSLPLPDWRSGLSEDLLESIGQRLALGHDAVSFRSACSPWRTVVPFTTFGPLLLLPFDPNSDRVGFYCVPEKKVLSKTLPDVRSKVACGSSCGWLVLMDEAASVMVHDRWVLHPTNGYGDADAASRAIKLEDMRGVFFHEIVLSAPPDAANRECVAMAMLGCFTKVAFCRVGVNSAWTLLDTKLEFSVGSIVHCQDKFLAIDYTGEISVCSSNAAGATPTATLTLLPSLSPLWGSATAAT